MTTITLDSDVTLGAGDTLDGSGDGSFALTIASGGGGLILTGDATFSSGIDDTLTVSAPISGSGSLTKSGAGTLTLTNTGNETGLPGGLTVSTGTLAIADDDALVGGTLTLDDGTTFQVTGTTTLDNAIALTGSGTYHIGTGATVTQSGVISGANGLTKTGTGTLLLDGANTYSGTTTVTAGTLGGNGSLTGALSIQNSATLAPGTSAGDFASGNLTLASGNLTLASGATLAVELGGTTAGTQYDQVQVTGAVDVTDATLDVSLLIGFTPTVGETFILIDNDDSEAVTGTFTGLAEGAVVTAGSATFTISYAAGTDNNDVVLTAVALPEIDLKGNGQSITDGDTTPSSADHTDFGSLRINAGAVSRTFTIDNTGAGALDLTGTPLVSLSGSGAVAFAVTTQPATDPIPASDSTTFTIAFDPSSTGTFNATVTLASPFKVV